MHSDGSNLSVFLQQPPRSQGVHFMYLSLLVIFLRFKNSKIKLFQFIQYLLSPFDVPGATQGPSEYPMMNKSTSTSISVQPSPGQDKYTHYSGAGHYMSDAIQRRTKRGKIALSWAIKKGFTKEVDLTWSLKGMMIIIMITNTY